MSDQTPADRLRLASYNVEWFNALFDDRGRLLEDREYSARYKITRGDQLAALGIVFTALDADGVMIIEAPDTNGRRSTVTALERFAAQYGLRARQAIIGYVSETEQEIAFLYDPDKLSVRHDPQGEPAPSRGAPGAPRFDSQLRLDINGDGVEDLVRFSKPPLELVITTNAGRELRLIGVHAKSKAPHGAGDDAAFKRISIDNRRKQLAECLWLRARIDRQLEAGDSLIVLGDFNDGPGLDEYEKLFGLSGIEIVLGQGDQIRLHEPHAAMALSQTNPLAPSTARFWLQPQKRYFEALLDFIMVSPDLAATKPIWRIWHPLDDPAVLEVRELADALLSASDHFPVTLDLAL
ncbi:endonuclease/exonuclease/phosphatase family protein [Cypionkella sp.]|uniref:endonuclease/exonuclease/phosphatase family protein n=1 Tax=Cypionkella sp. TaxID=2811411 RepID=UPI002ABB8D71|nr:endonuclease/exonuclease/phosphatase family protein [Cypionkella sp.]MDZ4394008.1 endonuclease [Cypionkella sp.]